MIRALEKGRPVKDGIAVRNDLTPAKVRIVKELAGDLVDPPRVYPLIGPASSTRQVQVYNLLPRRRPHEPAAPRRDYGRATGEVVYIDHSHLHQIGNVSAATPLKKKSD